MGRIQYDPKLVAADTPGQGPPVTIQFTWSGPGKGTWVNTPDPVVMRGRGNVVFHLQSVLPGAVFAGFFLKNGPNQPIFDSVSISGNGLTMVVHDNNSVQQGQQPIQYPYTVQVSYGSTMYYDDPVVVNDPPPDQWTRLPVTAATPS